MILSAMFAKLLLLIIRIALMVKELLIPVPGLPKQFKGTLRSLLLRIIALLAVPKMKMDFLFLVSTMKLDPFLYWLG